MNFEFITAKRIIVKTNGLQDLVDISGDYGDNVLLVCRKDALATNHALEYLQQANKKVTTIFVKGEPTIEELRANVDLAKGKDIDVVIAIGGGSVIDMGKMIAGLLTNTNDVLDYLEVIGEGQPMTNPSIPFIAIPTTSGTGAEVTKNGVVSSKKHQVKVSLRSPFMMADVVLIDATLTLSLPKEVTASTGMDALTQVIEPYVSIKSNPITDALAKEGIQRIAQSLKTAYDDPNNIEARQDMAIGSLLDGLSLANAKLGAVHGFAAVLGGMYPINHGVVCAILLPHVMKANIEALREANQQHPLLQRYKDVACLLTNNSKAKAEDGVIFIKELNKHLNIPTLKQFNIPISDIDDIIEKAKNSSSIKGNPIELTSQQLKNILIQAQ